jgi:asparagine synthase (glutamine-hydrolysing)
MCGISGYLNFDKTPISEKILQEMCRILSHRGPDNHGIFKDFDLGLSHTRLSIIDLTSAGNQPMQTEDERYVISYNGEVFNFREIRKELITLGWHFNSASDCEVVLKSLIQWGSNAIKKFNGQFAFAFWDRKEKVLILSRDRYGIKPLYFYKNNKLLVFGSEIKAILTHPKVKLEINKEGLLEYLSFQNFLSQQTLFKNINILEAGSFYTFKSDGKFNKKKYWDFNFEEPTINKLSIDECREECNYLLKQAVKRQLVSDVEIGSYLSGGMDSGTIAAIASKHLNHLRTFTCGFDLTSASGIERGMDEREQAEYMSSIFKTEHYQVVLKAGDMEKIMRKLVWHIEEPRVGQSYPNFYASQLASKFCKVVLSGDGGDEIFAGYPWRYYRALNNSNFDSYIEKYFNFWQRLVPSEKTHQLFSPMLNEGLNFCPKEIFRIIFKVQKNNIKRPEDYINHSLYFEAKTFLHGLLTIEDKISMSHGLETRVPFLDNDLVDFASNIPVKYKLGNLNKINKIDENETLARYLEKNREGKLLLRDVMKKHIPTKITKGIKKGFSGPDASWFKGESINYVKEMLFSKKAKIYEFLDIKTTHNLNNEHLEGKQNRRLLIWSLLNIEIWLDIAGTGKWQIK